LENNFKFSDIFSLHWFIPETFQNYQWEIPLFLFFIPLVPLAFFFRWIFHYRYKSKINIALHSSQLKEISFYTLFRMIPYVFIGYFMVFILIALARPQKIDKISHTYTEGIDIILALDVSESMRLEDLKPNRLEASKELTKEFIKERAGDRIGVVIFASEAYSIAPLSTDYSFIDQTIGSLDFDMLPLAGTAIGNAIAVGINRLRESQSGSKIIILLSDGDNTAGNLSPEMAAKLAAVYKIKIYTVGIGKEGNVAYTNEQGNKVLISNSLDESTLKELAQITGGKYFRAQNKKALKYILNQVDQLEKSRVKELNFTDTTDFYHIYLYWSLIFLIIWIGLKSTFMSNALED
jgi:Ca-activated chloride channel homolog